MDSRFNPGGTREPGTWKEKGASLCVDGAGQQWLWVVVHCTLLVCLLPWFGASSSANTDEDVFITKQEGCNTRAGEVVIIQPISTQKVECSGSLIHVIFWQWIADRMRSACERTDILSRMRCCTAVQGEGDRERACMK